MSFGLGLNLGLGLRTGGGGTASDNLKTRLNGQADLEGTLQGIPRNLAGSLTGSANLTGDVSVIKELAGSLTGSANLVGDLTNEWTPADLGSSLSLWLDADDASTITLNGSTVSQWSDKSGNAYHFAQGTAANQPTYSATGLNSKPTIDFDGTDDFLKNATFEPAGALTCFLVFNRDVIQGTFVNANRTNGIFELSGGFDASYRNIGFTATGTVNPSAGFDIAGGGTSQNTILGIQYDGSGSSATDFIARLDGTGQSIVSSGAYGFGAETGFSIGARPVQNLAYYNGRISELIFIQSQVSLLNLQKIEGYLAWKWGLESNLPIGHPYKTTPPTV